LDLIDDAGHTIHLEAPDRFQEILRTRVISV
jgi:pimeloyl-ACP methyl ester carboxylesterase